MRHCFFLFSTFITVAVLIVSVSFSQDAKEKPDAATIELLKSFAAKLDRTHDVTALRQIKEFNESLADAQLPTVEKFAVSDDGKELRWAFTWILADRHRYDATAHVITKTMSEVTKDREYRMWKWWETMFGERDDYKKMSHEIATAFLQRFEKGEDSEKLVIAEIFGQGEKEAKLSVNEFKKAIGYKDDQR